MRRIIIVGATSGLGNELAKIFISLGWKTGIAGRRSSVLEEMKSAAPDQVEYQVMDITRPEAPEQLLDLIQRLGGMDIYFHSAGTGKRNPQLIPEIETNTTQLNAMGFVNMITCAFNYMKEHGGGHIAVITSVAGTRGMGLNPSYSSTKKFQITYLDALAQLARNLEIPVRITDIRPGFVKTPMLSHADYPLLMDPGYVALKIFNALMKKRRRVIIDYRFGIITFFWKLIPQAIWERIDIGHR